METTIEKIKESVLEILKESDCLTDQNIEIVKQTIDFNLQNNEGNKNEIILEENHLSKWYSHTFLFEKDILNLCNAFSNKPIFNSDLGLNWFQFVGSNLKDTRPICKAMTKRRYFHVYEIGDIIKGIVDGRQLPVESNNLPEGFFSCTNEDNYLHLLNGRSCGHSFYFTSRVAVPEPIRKKILKQLSKKYPGIEIPQ